MTGEELTAKVTEALRGVLDPEIGINVVDLGLVCGIEATPARVAVALTMTTPSCPLGGYLTDLARQAIAAALPEVPVVEVELVWDPPWSADRMTPAARQALGWDDR
jgi:metal-sulfur cluster biosynthetic enzyme